MSTRSLTETRARRIGRWALFATLMLMGAAHAAFLPIDDFEGLQLGPIDDQNGWQALADNSAVVLDPDDPANQVLQVVTESTNLFHEAQLLDGEVRMLFLRFRFEAQLNVSWGMSGSAYPDQNGDFDVELNLANASNELRINDDGFYTVLTPLKPGTWYNAWLLIDNDDDVTAVWLHARTGEPAKPADLLSVGAQTAFAFRDGRSGDMRTFFIKTGGGNGVLGPLFIDDIYLEDSAALNLGNPASPALGWEATAAAAPTLANRPNPFNPRTTITFELPDRQFAEVTIHDLAGRTVAVLTSGVLAAGAHALDWHGRDRAGREVPSGMYLVKLQLAAGEQSRKIMLAR
jgi:hypothetical protein